MLLRWFQWYGARYLTRHFNGVRVSRSTAPPVTTGPLIIYLNHASWWDPLVCIALAKKFFPGRTSYAPIDSAALQRYRFFGKLGFFPVRRGILSGADFLRIAPRVLESSQGVLWITPQGRFADVRDPLQLRPGVGELMARNSAVTAVPIALEYAFWDERKPEVLVGFGKPLEAASAPKLSSAGWMVALSSALARTQAALAPEVIARNKQDFHSLLEGKAGIAPVFDTWTKLRGAVSGHPKLTPVLET